MKKLFLILFFALGGAILFANNSNSGTTGKTPTAPVDSTIAVKVVQTTGTSKQITAKKGQLTLTSDSLALYKKSDSLLIQKAGSAGLIPDGYTLTEKPR